jgi:DNA-binding beta-propeller fold protein YncE
MSRRFTAVVSLVGVVALGMAAIARPWPDPPAQGPAWPPAPQPARIRYVTSVSQPRDIGAGPSLLGRLAGFVLGRSRQPRLLRPRGIAVDSAGRVLVADPEQRMVHVLDVARSKYSFLQSAPFESPVGVAVAPDNTIYVTDSARRLVFAYGPDGRLKRSLGLVKGEQIFLRPTGIAVGRDGRLFVVDTLAARVYVLDANGGVLDVMGRRGGGDGEFNYPTDVSVGPDGSWYVVDALNARLQVFGPDGRFRWSFGRRGIGSGDFDKPKGVAVDSEGHVYVSDGLHDVVQIFDRDGRLLLVVGQSGSRPGEFSLPSGLFIDAANKLYVADSLNGRVQVFQYVSQPDAH